MTVNAEALFEQFCSIHRLACARVPTADKTGEQRPDYRVVGHDSTTFFAEIKEVTPSRTEAEEIRRILGGEVFARSTVPGARMRELISKANSQLRTVTKSYWPGVLVIYNQNTFLRHHTDPYAILTAMRGFDVVPVLVPQDPRESPIFQEVRSGPKKRMTAVANTSISAILLPYLTPDGTWLGDIFHNRHAACAISIHSITGSGLRHWKMQEDERDWERCNATA